VLWLQRVLPGGKSVAVVDYLGKPGSGKPHGNSAQPTSNYVHTPAATMQRVDERVHDKGSCKAVYDELVEDMDVEDAPQNSRVVRNKKQYNTAKDRGKAGDTHAATFADEVQRLCSMLPTDDFIQSITLTQACVPCVILYNKRQLCDLGQLCFHKQIGSVWSFDKTYNLGHMYVTVSVYRNVVLQRPGSNVSPTFIGPLFIHGNSDFASYSVFLNHLAACLCDCDFKQLRVGSDGEASLRKAVKFNMRGVCLVSCTRHLCENLRRYAQKVQIFKQYKASS